MTTPRFTPTETAILKILSDGLNHHPDELWTCLDEYTESKDALNRHICFIRKKLREIGHDIVAVANNRRVVYRRVVTYYGDDE